MIRISAWGLVACVAALPVFGVAQAAEDEIWGKASAILDKHCARCHQDGKLTGKFKERPAGNFGFVLDGPELVKRNKMIVGSADASEIFVKTKKGDMPKDIDDACYDGTATAATYCGLSPAELTSLHDAIDALKAPPAETIVATAPVAKTDDAKPPVVPVPVAPTVAQNTPPGPQVAPSVTPPVAQVAPQVAPAPQMAAAPRAFIRDAEVIRLIAEDSAKATDTDRPNWRYFTFTHMYNSGEAEKDLRVYRMALAKLLNGLSTESDPYTPVAVDPAQTIYRVDISRLGWSRATWDAIVAADPYVIFYRNPQFRALQNDLKTVVPFMRADWFAFAASRPPLYYSILGLPDTKGELQKKLGMDGIKNMDARKVERAGFQRSGVSDNNRMIERHSIGTGMYWESYDFGSNGDRKSIFQFPLGPPGAFGNVGKRLAFDQDGGEIIFSLPNGFHAYYLTDGKGHRLDTGPTKIVRDPAQRDLAVTNAISCMGCHDQGIKTNDFRPGQPLDQIRDLVLKSGSFNSDAKEIVAAIFPESDAFNRRLDSDAKRYAASLSAAGIDMKVKASGVEMVTALSKRFEENLNATVAAAELGMMKDEFLERLNAAGGQAYDLKLRLAQDVVPRDQFVALFAPLLNTISDNGDKAIDLTKVAEKTGKSVESVAKQTAKSPTTSKTFDLAFYASATNVKVGDLITFTLKSEQPCFLTLTDTDDKGRSTVLFPNAINKDNKIAAGVSIDVPGSQIGGFRIRAPEPGTERITASCNASFDQSVDLGDEKFKTFASTRDLLAAESSVLLKRQQEIKKRLLAVEAVPNDPNKPNLSVSSPAVNPSALVDNSSEPIVPIVAQKSVVIRVTK